MGTEIGAHFGHQNSYPKWVPNVVPILSTKIGTQNGHQNRYPFWVPKVGPLGTILVFILGTKTSDRNWYQNSNHGPLLSNAPWPGYLPPRMGNPKHKSIALQRRARPRCEHHLGFELIAAQPTTNRSEPHHQQIGEPASGRASPTTVATIVRTCARFGRKRLAA